MKTYNLIEAIQAIAEKLTIDIANITMIEYEDGSGYKFNFKTKNGQKHFIDLSIEHFNHFTY